MLQTFSEYWEEITAGLALVTLALNILTIFWVLTIKKDATPALAWCLVVLLLPLLGMLLFILFGYQQVHRPVSRKKRHKEEYRTRSAPLVGQVANLPGDGGRLETCSTGESPEQGDWRNRSWYPVAQLAHQFDALPPVAGNHFRFYSEGQPAYADKLEAIRSARHHIHLEYFIFQPDESGRLFLEVLAGKADAGVEVRLLYDAMGSHRLHGWMLRSLRAAGGQCRSFLPLDPLRRRIQINMRNHRKILVVDGTVAFTGGLNIGDEYLGKDRRYGYWRDTHLRVEGPLVAHLQRVFLEDWDFASGEDLHGPPYFPTSRLLPHNQVAQVIQSGPDQARKTIREVYFAAILRARQRLWIASPYFVPDAGLRDALCLAAYQGVDVRFLGLFRPDKWIPYFAGRYYWADVLQAGVKVYQYTRGMMHSKVILVDGEWASVGSANLDNRSMHLNFEVNCLVYSPEAVAELEGAFRRDLADSIQLDPQVFAHRPFAGRLLENACRLLSPVL
jgi:cardiolipin synthase